MKRFFQIFICLALIIFICIGLVNGAKYVMLSKYASRKPILTNEQRVKELNSYVKSLYAMDNNMYLYISSTNKIINLMDAPELKDVVSNFTPSINVKEIYETDTGEYTIPFEISLNWADTQIFIDIDSDAANNLVYICHSGSYYKAESSMDSIKQVREFAYKFK